MTQQEEILKLEREQLKFQKDNLNLFQGIIEGQATIKELVMEILHKFSKTLFIVILISFLGGIVIGTQYKSWLPYLDSLVSIGKNANQITKAIQ